MNSGSPNLDGRRTLATYSHQCGYFTPVPLMFLAALRTSFPAPRTPFPPLMLGGRQCCSSPRILSDPSALFNLLILCRWNLLMDSLSDQLEGVVTFTWTGESNSRGHLELCVHQWHQISGPVSEGVGVSASIPVLASLTLVISVLCAEVLNEYLLIAFSDREFACTTHLQ